MKLVTSACFSLLAGLAAPAAQATVDSFNTWAAFSSAVPAASVHDFNGLVIPTSTHFLIGPQTVAGVTFDSTKIAFAILGEAGRYGGANIFSGQSADTDPSDVVISLGGVLAFGVTYGAYVTTPATPVTITLSSGEVFVQNLPANSGVDTNFFGFVSTAPIAGLTLKTIANVLTDPPTYAHSLDVVSFAAVVPEPASWGLLALGLGLVGLAARQRGRCAG